MTNLSDNVVILGYDNGHSNIFDLRTGKTEISSKEHKETIT